MNRWTIKILSTWVLLGFVLSACNRSEDDRINFTAISGYYLPESATDFTWERKNHDEWGDHDGLIRFSASKEDLTKLLEKPFKGKAGWEPVGDSDSKFRMIYKDIEPGINCYGTIDLREGSFQLEYSTG